MKKSTKTKPAVYKTVLIEDEMGLAYIRVKPVNQLSLTYTANAPLLNGAFVILHNL